MLAMAASREQYVQLELVPYRATTHLEACLDVWQRASLVAHPFLGAETIASDLALVRDVYMPQAEVTVAEVDGQTAGFIALLGSLIGGLFADPARHRCGIGRALIAAAADRHGDLRVEVYQQNVEATLFYRACGFVPTGRRETDDLGRPFPLLIMERAR